MADSTSSVQQTRLQAYIMTTTVTKESGILERLYTNTESCLCVCQFCHASLTHIHCSQSTLTATNMAAAMRGKATMTKSGMQQCLLVVRRYRYGGEVDACPAAPTRISTHQKPYCVYCKMAHGTLSLGPTSSPRSQVLEQSYFKRT